MIGESIQDLNASSRANDETGKVERTTLLSLPDELLLQIGDHLCQDFVGADLTRSDGDHSDGSILRFFLTCRHLSTLLRPTLYRTAYISSVNVATRLLNTWQFSPDTRRLTKRLYCDLCDEPYITNTFLPALKAFKYVGGLEIWDLRVDFVIPVVEPEPPPAVPTSVSSLWRGEGRLKLKLLDLSRYCGFEDEDLTFTTAGPPEVKELRLGPLWTPAERYFGLETLENLLVFLDGPELDQLDNTQNAGIDVVKHYLPQLKILRIFGYEDEKGLTKFFLSTDIVDRLWSQEFLDGFKNNRVASVVEDYPLRVLHLQAFMLFYPSNPPPDDETPPSISPFTSLLLRFQHMPQLTTIYLKAFNFFIPKKEDVQAWNNIRFPKVNYLAMSLLFPDETDISGPGAFLEDDGRVRDLLHFLHMFPSLEWLDLSNVFDIERLLSNKLATSETWEAFGLIHPRCSLFVTELLEKTKIISIYLGMLHLYRRDGNENQWEKELVYTF